MALRVIKLVTSLPRSSVGDVLGNQVVRSGTSAAANDRSACKARSKGDFIPKLGIVEEEIDETQFWFELVSDAGLIKASCLESLLDEVEQLTTIFAASRITAHRDS